MEKITDLPLEDLIAACRVYCSEEILFLRSNTLSNYREILISAINQKHKQTQCVLPPANSNSSPSI